MHKVYDFACWNLISSLILKLGFLLSWNVEGATYIKFPFCFRSKKMWLEYNNVSMQVKIQNKCISIFKNNKFWLVPLVFGDWNFEHQILLWLWRHECEITLLNDMCLNIMYRLKETEKLLIMLKMSEFLNIMAICTHNVWCRISKVM